MTGGYEGGWIDSKLYRGAWPVDEPKALAALANLKRRKARLSRLKSRFRAEMRGVPYWVDQDWPSSCGQFQFGGDAGFAHDWLGEYSSLDARGRFMGAAPDGALHVTYHLARREKVAPVWRFWAFWEKVRPQCRAGAPDAETGGKARQSGGRHDLEDKVGNNIMENTHENNDIGELYDRTVERAVALTDGRLIREIEKSNERLAELAERRKRC